jgi:AraC-like DNA-binding protein
MDSAASPHARERALPTGTVELVFNLGDGRMRIFADDSDAAGQTFDAAVICGPQSRYFVLDTSKPASVIGVHFKPGGAAAFLGAPAGEFADRHLGLDDAWGSRAADLRDRLLAADSDAASFAVLEQGLLARMRRPLLPHPAVVHALAQLAAEPTLSRIATLREEAGYSHKRFIELFRDSVGLTPKLFGRIQRFQSVLGLLTRGERVEWAGVAADGGFYDQSHLNREFRAFSGTTPGDYQPLGPDRPSHVAVNPAE